MRDLSNGYEAAAGTYMAGRGSSILDLGCGDGVPIARTLIEEGLSVHGVDASAAMSAAFRARFPHAPVACEAVEGSRFFARTFDGVIAWGLMFLLPPGVQPAVIRALAAALNPGGRFLFTSPRRACTWADLLTESPSTSLGSAAYEAALVDAGLTPVGEHRDEGENDYFEAAKLVG